MDTTVGLPGKRCWCLFALTFVLLVTTAAIAVADERGRENDGGRGDNRRDWHEHHDRDRDGYYDRRNYNDGPYYAYPPPPVYYPSPGPPVIDFVFPLHLR